MKTKQNFLAGANTSQGFINKFDEILNPSLKGFTYVLKGGPGTGKSTLLKKISNHFYELGFSVENYFCSSDVNSFDAVRIVEKNICVVDGTSPHEQDASIPMINSKIVNLGDCISCDVYKNKKNIEALIKLKQDYFKKAYGYLKCLENFFGDKLKTFSCDIKDSENLFTFMAKIKKFKKKGSLRTVFFDFFDDNGLNNLEKFNTFETYCIKNNQHFIHQLKINLIDVGVDVIQVLDIFSLKLKGLILPNENLYLKVNYRYSQCKNSKYLIKKVTENLSMARQCHKKIEHYYINNLNFEDLNKITNKIIQEIETKKL